MPTPDQLIALIPAIDRKVQSLWRESPFGNWQYVDVTFPGGVDVDIPHTLKVTDVEGVRWLVCMISGDTTVYKDLTITRKPWQVGHIWLRTGAACTARLLLFLERN